MMKISDLKTMDVEFALPDIGQLEISGVLECLHSGWLTSGAKVKEFETGFANAVGASFAVSFNSATMAALVLMEALGVGPGTEVVVPTWTFSGPAMMAHKLGAQVVLSDVDDRTFNMDAASLASVVTRRTALVLPTHFAGLSCDMRGLLAACDLRGIDLIDDAAHAFPAHDERGCAVGAQATRATFFSFYATKPITTGEGGMVVTNDHDLWERMCARRSHGMNRDAHSRTCGDGASWAYDVEQPGWKANMSDIAAALGLAQLQRAAELHAARRAIAARYTEAFADAERLGWMVRPVTEAGHAWHLYPLRVTKERDRFITAMRARGVRCSVHFMPLHKHSFWREHAVNGMGQFAHADLLFTQEVSLPIYSKMSVKDVQWVIDSALDVIAIL
jgi:dTDP-4-amino-4,6-dideoxygalactose transaminase